MNRIAFFLSTTLLLCGCEKSAPPPEPIPTPTPIPTPRPTPTPAPTPQARLAPKGIFYVVKAFSVVTDEGILGFPAGKKVTLIKQQPGQFTVSDGVSQGSAPIENFTNDLDVAGKIVTAEVQKQTEIAERGKAWQEQARAQYLAQFTRSTPAPETTPISQPHFDPTPKPTPQSSVVWHDGGPYGPRWHKGINGQPVYEHR